MTQSGGTVTDDKDEVTRAGQPSSVGKLGPVRTIFIWPNTEVAFGKVWCGECLQAGSGVQHGSTNGVTGVSSLQGLQTPRRRWAVGLKPLKGITRIVTGMGDICGGHVRSSVL